MVEEKSDFGTQQFNAADLLKKNTVTQVFKSFDDACKKQEPISENSHETSFTKRVDLVEGLLWKYTPKEIKDVIRELHEEKNKKFEELDNKSEKDISDANKLLTKRKISFEYAVEILKLISVVLTNSPISIEYAEMEITGDFKDLIKAIRQEEPVKLFATEVET